MNSGVVVVTVIVLCAVLSVLVGLALVLSLWGSDAASMLSLCLFGSLMAYVSMSV